MSVILEFESGLGNQLFQFAAGYTLAKKHQTQLIGDTSRYCKKSSPDCRVTFRQFHLESLGFPMSYRNNPPASLFHIRGFPRVFRFARNARLTSYRCMGAHTPVFDNLPDESFLSGHFQDLSYFREEREDIYTIIENRLEHLAKNKAEPLPYNWGALHIRLGDHLKIPEFYPDWFAKYYLRATELLLESHRCAKVKVFSDDPAQAKEMLAQFKDKVIFANGDQSHGGALDLYEMSTATVVGISNSCFSWWAAFLASKTGSRVIAPRYWSEWCKEPEKLLYPDDWDIHGFSIDDNEDYDG